MRVLKLVLVSLFTLVYNGYSQKMNGVNFVAEQTTVDPTGFDDLKKINAEWIAWVPYAFGKVQTGELLHGLAWQWQGETLDGTEKAIELAREKGLKVMLKPHVWLSDHSFTGTLELSSEQWKVWQSGFTDYILAFAELAEQYNVELFCIGTEQYASIDHDGKYWEDLISKVRTVYKGKITYAANWDTFQKCPFWNQLDYIGVDAYFPLSEAASPSLRELQTHWKKWKRKFYQLHRKNGIPLFLTEFGYRTTEFATKEPWVSVTDEKYCEQCQADALKALFETFWSEDWFAGAFLWKWFEPNKSVQNENLKSFTVKDKMAETVLSKYYGSSK